ncbi:MAG: hypothetical protein J0I23_30760 [Rhizobiales bacterium]|nr:hypothetical protein [Hyphomicrobiales bacterium]
MALKTKATVEHIHLQVGVEYILHMPKGAHKLDIDGRVFSTSPQGAEGGLIVLLNTSEGETVGIISLGEADWS